MRLFFSIWPPPAQTQRLAALAGDCVRRFGGVAMRQDTIHLTLAFLGEVPATRLPELLARVAAVRTTGFELCIDRLGYWRHNRLLWAGCTKPPEGLLTLAADLRKVLDEVGIPLDDAARRFTPHLTLARKVSEKTTLPDWPDMEPVCWQSDGFVLVESQLSSVGATYRPLAEFGWNV